MPKLRNVTGREYCAACGDDGWVELGGTQTIAGTIYSHGIAPCKWCEIGDRRFQRHSAPNQGHGQYEPETNFDGSDIVPVGEHKPGRPFRPDTAFLRERAASGVKIGALQAMFPRSMWPAEWAEPAPGRDQLGGLLAADADEAKQRAAVLNASTPITVDEAEVREKVLRARMALNEQFAPIPASQEPISAPGENDQEPHHVPDEGEVPY